MLVAPFLCPFSVICRMCLAFYPDLARCSLVLYQYRQPRSIEYNVDPVKNMKTTNVSFQLESRNCSIDPPVRLLPWSFCSLPPSRVVLLFVPPCSILFGLRLPVSALGNRGALFTQRRRGDGIRSRSRRWSWWGLGQQRAMVLPKS